MSYTQPADLPFVHTWYHNDARWEDSIFFPSPTSGIDTLTTIEVNFHSLSNLFGRGDRANWSRIYNDER
jgi:hypothetical protein